MKIDETIKLLRSDSARILIARLCGRDGVEANVRRYENLLAGYKRIFGGEGDVMLFSSPSRMEINGNHTDHSHGKMLVGNTDLNCVGVAGKNEFNQVHIAGKTYSQDSTIDLNHLEPNKKKAGTVDLVEGLLRGFKNSDYNVRGFNAYATSNVISTAEVSSSASFEMLLCSTFNIFFNGGRMSTMAYIHTDKFAENNYWDKASDLLGQMACVMGGLTTIDFMKSLIPKVEKIDLDFGSQSHSLIVTQTGKGRTDLSVDYSAVPAKMKEVARYFGKEVLSQASEERVIDNLAEVRQLAEDRSVLRALHFSKENKRTEAEVLILRENRSQDFLANVTTSGDSSWKRLQSCFINSNYQKQGTTVTLTLMELFIAEKQRGACRIHEGGSTGVIMAVLPNELVDEPIHYIEECIGGEGAYRVSIHPHGVICPDNLVQLCSVFST